MRVPPAEHDAYWAGEGLFVIADAIQAKRGDDGLLVNDTHLPDFVCLEFELRAHCGCEGLMHPNGCPPNFVYHAQSGVFTIRWENFLGKRMVASAPKPEGMRWELAVAHCIRAVDRA